MHYLYVSFVFTTFLLIVEFGKCYAIKLQADFFFLSLQDVHHGNGTQEIFDRNKSVSFVIIEFHLTMHINLLMHYLFSMK